MVADMSEIRDRSGGDRLPVGIVGAGPVGLTVAARLASFGISCVLFEAEATLKPQGSKACLIQGDVLEILDAFGCAERIADEGVTWSVGHTYVRDREIRTEVYPERPGFGPFVNISQYRIEQVLLEHVLDDEQVEVRWSHRVTGLKQGPDHVVVEVATAAGPRFVDVSYLVACDGVRSDLRELAGVRWTGYSHGDRFLITDIRAVLPFAKERHFHYDPSSNPGRQLVIHPQPENVWRIDWQLAPQTDVAEEQWTGAFDRRVRSVIGDRPYEVAWWSTYRFHQRVIDRFVVGRVLFAGDAAHALPPYGARGMNSGIQDADNLAWKVALVLRGDADVSLLQTYHDERFAAATDNLAVTEATIRFMVPPTRRERLRRRLYLRLSRWLPPARQGVNSGRMAEPSVYRDSTIVDTSSPHPLVGHFAPDGWVTTVSGRQRIRRFLGGGFVVLAFVDGADRTVRLLNEALAASLPIVPTAVVVSPPGGPAPTRGVVTVHDDEGRTLRERFSATRPTWLLVRPDGHICSAGPLDGDPPDLHDALSRSARLRARREPVPRQDPRTQDGLRPVTMTSASGSRWGPPKGEATAPTTSEEAR